MRPAVLDSALPTLPVSRAELAEVYSGTGLDGIGISMERALEIAPVRMAMENTVRCGRRRAAHRAGSGLHLHHAGREADAGES